MIRGVRMIAVTTLGALLVCMTLGPTPAASTLPIGDRAGQSPAEPDAVERGTLRLHYVQKPIGYERYEVSHAADALTLTSDFDFTDRGGRVQLAATLRTRADYTPLSFKATGKSYRFVNVDSDVRVQGDEAIVKADGAEVRVPVSAPFYTIDGYAPFA